MVQQSLPQRESPTKIHQHQNQHQQQEKLQYKTNGYKISNQPGIETSL